MATITKTAFVADLAVNAVVATMPQALIDGHGIILPGLGTFSLKERAGRNLATGKSLEIPAKRTVSSKSPAISNGRSQSTGIFGPE